MLRPSPTADYFSVKKRKRWVCIRSKGYDNNAIFGPRDHNPGCEKIMQNCNLRKLIFQGGLGGEPIA